MEEIHVVSLDRADYCKYIRTDDFDFEVFEVKCGKIRFETRGKSGQVLRYKAVMLGGEYDGVFLDFKPFTAYMRLLSDALVNGSGFRFPEPGDVVQLPTDEEADAILSDIPDNYRFVSV